MFPSQGLLLQFRGLHQPVNGLRLYPKGLALTGKPGPECLPMDRSPPINSSYIPPPGPPPNRSARRVAKHLNTWQHQAHIRRLLLSLLPRPTITKPEPSSGLRDNPPSRGRQRLLRHSYLARCAVPDTSSGMGASVSLVYRHSGGANRIGNCRRRQGFRSGPPSMAARSMRKP